ncbi:adhesion G-protein coupled receptor G4 isoform X1 [Coregonus clupeaformis]|uniref:adhesion G-protein coupled receptor G4 isoform X1 n=1 Tax=Coregonus clupeaformis TaxID=59861 RepID=UPI001BE011CD|nr:adhesion G-protein coupled receptor G4 isoform X1 [Coregonus clupeaformis]
MISSYKSEAWSLYEVKVKITIICYDGNSTDKYKARDLAHQWLRKILPSNKYYLYRVSVSVSTRPFHTLNIVGETYEEEGQDKPKLRAEFNTNNFDCLVHLNVIPSSDVSTVQKQVSLLLNTHHNSGHLTLVAKPHSIQVNAVEDFPRATHIPPIDIVTEASSDTTTDLSVTTGGKLSDIYFEVDANVTLTGSCDNPRQTIINWLYGTLPAEMSVLTFQLLVKAYSVQHPSPRSNTTDSDRCHSFLQPSLLKTSRHGCLFRVRVTTSSSQEETTTRIRTLLEKIYTNDLITIETKSKDIKIRHIRSCLEHRHQTRHGLFVWPVTWAPQTATLPCQGDPSKTATRLCLLGITISWGIPDLHQCPFVVETITDLDNIEVTPENAMDVVEMIESLLEDHPHLNCTELDTVLTKLKNIVFISWMTPPLGKAIISIISDMLESKSYLQHVTNQILNITEMVGDKMSCFSQTNYTLVAPAMAISVVDVDPVQFQSLTFGVSSTAEGLNPEIYINKDPFKGTVALISLPSALKYSFPQHSGAQPRVQFQFYGIPTLFMNNPSGKILNTYVVSASVTNASGPIKDLEEDVEVTLHHLMSNTLGKGVQCVYWDFNQNEGNGGWEQHGCRKHNTSADYTTCLCDHLTHFGVLLDVSRTPVDIPNEEILTIITYLGCGVSSLFLGITVLTYTAFEKLRRDYPSKILINLSLALLGLNMVFLVNSWLSSFGSYGLCVAVASTLHYFLLASFTWMGLEAVHMYFALVKVFNVYVPSYILKFCALGWGIPLVMCCLVLVMKRESYGSSLGSESIEPLDNPDAFCWIQDEVTFYVSVVGYILLVLLCNMATFVVVLVQIRHMRVNQPTGIHSGLFLQDLKGVSSLTFLLGLTWTVAFFAWGPAKVPLIYVFCVLNSLQGFFIFLFHCLMKENVRKQWRIHLCFGSLRLQEYSEWSHTATVGAKYRPNPLVRMPSVRSIKSSATDSTSASSDSSQRQVSIRRPNLDLVYVNSFALPRVQCNATPLPHKRASFPEEGNYEGPTWQDGSHPRHRLPIP